MLFLISELGVQLSWHLCIRLLDGTRVPGRGSHICKMQYMYQYHDQIMFCLFSKKMRSDLHIGTCMFECTSNTVHYCTIGAVIASSDWFWNFSLWNIGFPFSVLGSEFRKYKMMLYPIYWHYITTSYLQDNWQIILTSRSKLPKTRTKLVSNQSST